MLSQETVLPENAAEMANQTSKGTYLGKLGIEIVEWTHERVVATMPVEGNTQPDGFLHGGATMSLAESIASMGAAGVAGWPEKIVMGLQQTCNFLSTATSGSVRGVATPVNIGRTTHLWDVDITSVDTGKRIASARVTIAVREPRAKT
ncbi:MAG: PaaI family thioesterase [Actinomycetota bacterium]|nr:PaaI family thioesterase [Actinomycetota bacterium]